METKHSTESFFFSVACFCCRRCPLLHCWTPLWDLHALAGTHTSSGVWNRGRLFINKPPHTRPRPEGVELTGRRGDQDGRSKIRGHSVEWKGECESRLMILNQEEDSHTSCCCAILKLSCCCRRDKNYCVEEVLTCGKFRVCVCVCWCIPAAWCARVRAVTDVRYEGEKSVFGCHVLLLRLGL